MAKIDTPKDVTLIKLGGSIVTDKSKNQHYRREMVRQLGKELAQFQQQTNELLFIGHGQGSYAHPIVKKYAEHFTSKDAFQAHKMVEMLRVISKLHEQILDDLIGCGLPAVSYRFSQQASIHTDGQILMNLDLFEHLFELQTVPLTTGDIVVDANKGNAVLSTEKIFFKLINHLQQSPKFRVKRVAYVTEVEGVLDHDRKLISHIGASQKLKDTLFYSNTAQSDVTGAMKHKVESAQAVAHQGIPVAIFSPLIENNLSDYLNEKSWRGTLISANRES
jgi:isopentenyl phosphate kinase